MPIPNSYKKDSLQVKKQLMAFDRKKVSLWSKEADLLPLNYTLNCYPKDNKFIQKLQKTLGKLVETDPNQYWYPMEKYHMTILGLIKYTEEKHYEQKLISKIQATLDENHIRDDLDFYIAGMSSNNKAASVLCYPSGFDLFKLREDLRKALGIPGKDYTEYLNVYEKIAWINFIRYKHIPPQKFEEVLKNMGETDFGKMPFGLHLRLNSSSTLKNSKIVHTFF